MEIERIEDKVGVLIRLDDVYARVRAPYLSGMVDWYSTGPITPDSARAFAQRIIAVADAVEAELKGGK